jgi:tRNA G18 (ribose-2'-O)-methylase SpoU
VQPVDWSAALSDPAALRSSGLFVAEGRLVLGRVLDGAAGGPDAIVSVLAAPSAVKALDLEARLAGRVTVRSPEEMAAITGFNFHRGVLALVRRPPMLSAREAIAEALTAGHNSRPALIPDGSKAEGPRPRAQGDGRRPVIVVAEHLVDVDNVGSCFRNTRGFGAACVLVDDRCPDPLYRKAVRTSMGHVLEMPWARAPIDEILDALQDRGIATIGLTPHDRRPSGPGHEASAAERRVPTLPETRMTLPADAPVAILVGNEGDGLSAATIARCTHLARIPMAEGADSLNVATALAIALYELTLKS